jgi:hypothetical protein
MKIIFGLMTLFLSIALFLSITFFLLDKFIAKDRKSESSEAEKIMAEYEKRVKGNHVAEEDDEVTVSNSLEGAGR